MTYRLFVDSNNGIDVEPEYDYKEPDEKIENRHRVRSGEEYVYKWGEFNRWEFSVEYINSSDRAIINSWWSSNTDLLWMEEGSSVVSSVHITNKTKPVDKPHKPYSLTLWKGVLKLGSY